MDPSRTPSPLHRPDGQPVRILVVDDEPDVTDVLAAVVAGEGWQVRTAADGMSALAAARDFRPDAVILDWMLPDLDGLRVLSALRREAPRVCVLFLTARDAVEDRVAGITAGGDDYVTKPYSIEEVLARLRGLLRRAGMSAEPSTHQLTVGELVMDEDAREVSRRRLDPVLLDDGRCHYADADQFTEQNLDRWRQPRQTCCTRRSRKLWWLSRPTLRRRANAGLEDQQCADPDAADINRASVQRRHGVVKQTEDAERGDCPGGDRNKAIDEGVADQAATREMMTQAVARSPATLRKVLRIYVMAAMYASYHGADGLTGIARRVHGHAEAIGAALGDKLVHDKYFDTILANVPGRADAVVAAAKAHGINLWRVDDDHVSVTCDEVTTDAHVAAVLDAFGATHVQHGSADIATRTSQFLTHPAFTSYRTETSMMRYLRSLADKDLALDRTMIPLGSCTMKLNAAAEMESITWPEFARQHPFAPASDSQGLRRLIADLETWLVQMTGYDAISLQPNAGSQGEYAGLLAIHAYHASRGESERNICLIPSSAHGTNAASAALAGMRVVVVACRSNGDVDLDDLRTKVSEHADRLSTLMITYPSTHGVYEQDVAEVCAAVHDAGGQVYIDGANLNALVGLARPGKFGGDVSHLNLHKTFCIPHGGGGPGVGPVAARSHLAPFLPGHPYAPELPAGPTVSAAPYGSASILPISWAYIRMMGAPGLRAASLTAIASANYIARRLDEYYPVLYTGENGMVAHECILDLRPITKSTGVTVDDVAKRLADYGFHAPTMSFPVAGTLMVEPTESESLAEVDAFCDAMIAIRGEIDKVGAGEWPVEDNPLRGAPHTAECLLVDKWEHPYTREVAAYPLGKGVRPKVWPAVRRIDGAYGDRNLVCSCPPVESYA